MPPREVRYKLSIKPVTQTELSIIKKWIDPEKGLTREQAVSLGQSLHLTDGQIESAADIFYALWNNPRRDMGGSVMG